MFCDIQVYVFVCCMCVFVLRSLLISPRFVIVLSVCLFVSTICFVVTCCACGVSCFVCFRCLMLWLSWFVAYVFYLSSFFVGGCLMLCWLCVLGLSAFMV